MQSTQSIFKGSISIQDLQGNVYVKETLSSAKQAKDFLDGYGQSIPGWGHMKVLYVPTRTDNLKDFVKDLFFPATFYSNIMRINNMALDILFKLFVTIPLDFLLLIPRLITSPFRKFYQSYWPIKSPLEEYTRLRCAPGNPTINKAMSEGLLVIKIQFEMINEDQNQQTVDGQTLVSLKVLPGFEKLGHSNYLYTANRFDSIKNEWKENKLEMQCLPSF